MKNQIDLGKVVLEGLVGIVLSVAAEGILAKFKERRKQEAFEETLVSDLTVEELRKILREE